MPARAKRDPFAFQDAVGLADQTVDVVVEILAGIDADRVPVGKLLEAVRQLRR